MKNIRIFTQIIVIQLFAFASAQIYQFTNCAKTGAYGPSQAQCDSEYNGTNLEDQVTINSGKQQWTVPYSGSYSFDVFGASGATYEDPLPIPGHGARMKSSLNLNSGTILTILVGQQGSTGYGNGGGGASFIQINNEANPLILAAGGGGTGLCCYANTEIHNGGDGLSEFGNGNGGDVGGNGTSGGCGNPGGGGGGWLSAGIDSYADGGEVLSASAIGGYEQGNGQCITPSAGGFGGGGSGGNGGGGGGGFEGGNGGANQYLDGTYPGGEGGKSFIFDGSELLLAESGVNVGHGSVTITYLGPDLPDPITSIDITGTSGYRMLSSPVSGAVYGDLLEELYTQGMAGSDDPDNGGANAWTWNNSWNALTDLTTDNYTAGSGVLVYVFADTDFDGTDNLPVTLTLDGTQNTSPVTIATNDDSWNLLGNPYGYALSIQQLAADNAGHSAVYIWDNTTNAYKIHNGTTGDIADGLIAPFQGFWSRADADAASYNFSESSISPDAGTNYRTTTDDTPGSAIFSFHVGDYTSSTYLSFTPEGHINLDQADASRLMPMSSMEHLTSMIHESGKSLAINNLPLELSNDISFPMDVMMLSPTDEGYETQAEQINLTWDVTNLPAGISLELKNNITGQNINLTGYPSVNINLPSKGGLSMSEDFMATYPVVGDAHFTVSVNSTLAGLGDDVIILPEQLILHNAYPNPFNPNTLIRFDLLDANMVSLDIFDLTGKQVSSLINEYMIPGSHQISWSPGNLPSGVYIVKLSAGNTSLNQKITYIK